jgi:hypothetical protein
MTEVLRRGQWETGVQGVCFECSGSSACVRSVRGREERCLLWQSSTAERFPPCSAVIDRTGIVLHLRGVVSGRRDATLVLVLLLIDNEGRCGLKV